MNPEGIFEGAREKFTLCIRLCSLFVGCTGPSKAAVSNNGFVVLLMAEILHELIGSLSHDLQGFIHPRWCRNSSINSSTTCLFFWGVLSRQKRRWPFSCDFLSVKSSLYTMAKFRYTTYLYNNLLFEVGLRLNLSTLLFTLKMFGTLPETSSSPMKKSPSFLVNTIKNGECSMPILVQRTVIYAYFDYSRPL